MTMEHEPLGEMQIDDAAVERYFDGAGGTAPTAMSMMAHEHNLPSSALEYRLSKELRTIKPWLDTVSKSGRVLDVGCGAGAWVEIFSKRYSSVIGVERSSPMIEAARKRVAHLSSAQILQGDGRQILPAGPFEMIFLGGLCMYLCDTDVVALLRSLKSRLSEGGKIILRVLATSKSGTV
jgi:protein-L-isoaspartate O-methyltransferase